MSWTHQEIFDYINDWTQNYCFGWVRIPNYPHYDLPPEGTNELYVNYHYTPNPCANCQKQCWWTEQNPRFQPNEYIVSFII